LGEPSPFLGAKKLKVYNRVYGFFLQGQSPRWVVRKIATHICGVGASLIDRTLPPIFGEKTKILHWCQWAVFVLFS